MSDEAATFLGLLFGVPGLVALVLAVRAGFSASRLGDALASFRRIGELEPGARAEVRGRVVVEDEEELVPAPVSRVKCAHYHFRLERWEPVDTGSPGRRAYAWNPRVDEHARGKIELDDGTGRVTVLIPGAYFDVATTTRWRSRRSPIGPRVPDDVRMAITTTYRDRGLAAPPIRYTEMRIEPDALVYVLGDVVAREDGELRITRRDGLLVVSDVGAANLVRRYERRARITLIAGLALVIPAAVFFAIALAG